MLAVCLDAIERTWEIMRNKIYLALMFSACRSPDFK